MAVKQVLCAIRNTGSGWSIISNGAHQPMGCSSISRVELSPGNFVLQLVYDFTGTKVHSLIVGPDETFAGVYHAGASVGLVLSNITIKDMAGNQIDPNTIVSPGGNFWIIGFISE